MNTEKPVSPSELSFHVSFTDVLEDCAATTSEGAFRTTFSAEPLSLLQETRSVNAAVTNKSLFIVFLHKSEQASFTGDCSEKTNDINKN